MFTGYGSSAIRIIRPFTHIVLRVCRATAAVGPERSAPLEPLKSRKRASGRQTRMLVYLLPIFPETASLSAVNPHSCWNRKFDFYR